MPTIFGHRWTGGVRVEHLLSPQVIFALNQTLLQQEKLREGAVVHVPYTTDDLIQHYNCGDLNAVIFNHDTSQVREPPLVLPKLAKQHKKHKRLHLHSAEC